jgi:hypothetical protein
VDPAPQSPVIRFAKPRSGVALFAALALLGVIALLVGGSLAAFRLAARSSAFARTDAVLTEAADYAINSVVSASRQLGLDTIPLGVARTFAPSGPGTTDSPPVVVATRLVGGIVWLVADVTANGIGDGHRRVNVIARWHVPGLPPPSALVSRGDVRLAAGVAFSIDSTGDADCRAPSSSAVTVAPGATVVSADSVTVASSALASDSATYFLLASQLSQLASGAGFTHVVGDTTITGGSFRGVLVVEGALTITGPFAASGLVISRGPIIATGGGLSVTGALLSFAGRSTTQLAADIGPAAFRYSQCAIILAIRHTVPLRPVTGRSWAELF